MANAKSLLIASQSSDAVLLLFICFHHGDPGKLNLSFSLALTIC